MVVATVIITTEVGVDIVSSRPTLCAASSTSLILLPTTLLYCRRTPVSTDMPTASMPDK